jgi:NAD+ synthase (glutamine-hydrolysing)
MTTLRVGLAQINTTIGDLEGNVRLVAEYARRARVLGADVVAFPELTITGYPPEDLLLRSRFIEDNRSALAEAAAACTGLTAVMPRARRAIGRQSGSRRRSASDAIVRASP